MKEDKLSNGPVLWIRMYFFFYTDPRIRYSELPVRNRIREGLIDTVTDTAGSGSYLDKFVAIEKTMLSNNRYRWVLNHFKVLSLFMKCI
jgi:hypothetical protein